MRTLTLFTLTLLLTAMLLTTATAQEKEVVVSIPDANLANAIREALQLEEGTPITAAALHELTRLEARGKGIAALTGLEHATNLTSLDLGSASVNGVWQTNPIADVSALANLTQLTYLSLNGTAVSDVAALANLTQLKTLYFWGTTAVSDVAALANLTQLKTLSLDDTAVSDVSALANLTQLTTLSLNGTAVSDVAALANLTNLTRLKLERTAVSDVAALANLTQLTRLSLGGTAVSDVAALANLTQLEELHLENCPLNADAHQVHIPAIQANGTEVRFSPFQTIHLPRVPNLVSLIYFRPSDRPVRPNVDAEIDALIKKAQRFFADQLERHGFDRKTFQFETDAHGNAVVHHVTGKFPNAHYQNSGPWQQEIDAQIYIPPRSFRVYMLDSDPERSFIVLGGLGGRIGKGGLAAIDNSRWTWDVIAHELGHAFGMEHDFRSDAYLMSYGSLEDELSQCAAEWLDVHPAFNPGQPVSTSKTTIKMLPPTLASPPNTIRLRFEVTDRDGLHQAQLQIPDFVVYSGQYSRLLDCKRLTGDDNTVEFVTTELTPRIDSVTLQVIDVHGNMSENGFAIDVSSLLPPAKVVSLPDPNLAAAVRETLSLSSSEAITTHAMLELKRLDVRNRGIRDLTGLEHAINLTEVDLGPEYISGEGDVNSNAVSDFSPLGKLTNLSTLNLGGMSGFSDVSALANLTQLTTLNLNGTDVSDVAALANLTQLTSLELGGTAVSDVAALANLTQLTSLELGGTAVSDVAALANLTQLTWLYLEGTNVSDVAALANLTQLTSLGLWGTAVSDVAALAHLTQLTELYLVSTAVSDVAALANLTQLEGLYLQHTAVSDVSPLLGLNLTGTDWDSIGLRLSGCPLSYASINTHIPAMQAKGIEVEFDNVAHPALLKVAGEGDQGNVLSPLVVEATDENGQPIVGKTVLFENLQGGGTLSANTVETDARGRAQVTLTLGETAGSSKVKASAEGIQSWVLFNTVVTETAVEAPQLAADVNEDGVVDLADLAIVAQALGKPVQNPRADVNADGVVDGEDFAQVAANLGEGEAAAPSPTGLPARFTRERVEWALNLLHAENTGSPAFRRGIAKLEGFLALLIPDQTLLLANYPNPFNPETWIPYELAAAAEVEVSIYAADGKLVRTLELGQLPAGTYQNRSRAAYWDGRNAQGEPVASGVYFYTLRAGEFSATRKMVIRK